MQLKKLQFNDIYEFADIIKNLDFELTAEEIKELDGNQVQAGIKMVSKAIGNLKKSKTELNSFLGYMFGISGEEFGNLGLKEMAEAIKQLKEFKNSEDYMLFFELVGQLTQSK